MWNSTPNGIHRGAAPTEIQYTNALCGENAKSIKHHPNGGDCNDCAMMIIIELIVLHIWPFMIDEPWHQFVYVCVCSAYVYCLKKWINSMVSILITAWIDQTEKFLSLEMRTNPTDCQTFCNFTQQCRVYVVLQHYLIHIKLRQNVLFVSLKTTTQHFSKQITQTRRCVAMFRHVMDWHREQSGK